VRLKIFIINPSTATSFLNIFLEIRNIVAISRNTVYNKNVVKTRYQTMQQEIQKISFFLITLILIILVMIPLLTTIQSGFDSTNGYYENSN